MKPRKPPAKPSPRPASPPAPLHRSGAVARMLRMPVATLRVWERRYALTRPELSPSGQRLYSADDVRRLALIKQLTDLGHAIGSLAALGMPALQRVASTHAHVLAAAKTGRSSPGVALPERAWRLAVIGAALARRLRRPALLRRLGRPLALLGPFDDSAEAAAALGESGADALLFHASQLHAGWLADADAAAPALARIPKAVVYGFAADATCESLANAGTALLREPQPDAVLGQWLRCLCMAGGASLPSHDEGLQTGDAVPPRRWDDAALADFAGLSSTIACECPRHVAELLMQLSHFEAYSAECERRSAADGELHAYLRQVAAASRARFEAALEQVALHEGLLLPASPGAVAASTQPLLRPPPQPARPPQHSSAQPATARTVRPRRVPG